MIPKDHCVYLKSSSIREETHPLQFDQNIVCCVIYDWRRGHGSMCAGALCDVVSVSLVRLLVNTDVHTMNRRDARVHLLMQTSDILHDIQHQTACSAMFDLKRNVVGTTIYFKATNAKFHI